MACHHVREETDGQRDRTKDDFGYEVDQGDQGFEDDRDARGEHHLPHVSEEPMPPDPNRVVREPRDYREYQWEGDPRVHGRIHAREDLPDVPEQDEEEQGGQECEEHHSLLANHLQYDVLPDELEAELRHELQLARNDRRLPECDEEEPDGADDGKCDQEEDEVVAGGNSQNPNRWPPTRPYEVLCRRLLERDRREKSERVQDSHDGHDGGQAHDDPAHRYRGEEHEGEPGCTG